MKMTEHEIEAIAKVRANEKHKILRYITGGLLYFMLPLSLAIRVVYESYKGILLQGSSIFGLSWQLLIMIIIGGCFLGFRASYMLWAWNKEINRMKSSKEIK